MSNNNTTSATLRSIAYQLASLGIHAQLTRCFSAVAELLVSSPATSALLELVFSQFGLTMRRAQLWKTPARAGVFDM